jgi:hypothetical protein
MRKILFFTAIILAGLSAQANIDVTCRADLTGKRDCLTQGWDVFDTYKNDNATVVCANGDCATQGWTGTFKDQADNTQQDYTECKGGSCFRNGWLVYQAETSRLLVDVTCRIDNFGYRDCLRAGWDIADYANRINQQVLCINGNCEYNGWDLFTQGYPITPTRCKFGGCFNAGWITYR